jgi:hypothetical protein
VKTASGETQTYQVNPALISSLKLQNGSEIVIDSTRLQTGRIVRIGAYSVSVQSDQGGETKEYFLPRQSRRYLSYGDRVVITPDQRLVRYDLYQLSSADLRLQPEVVASSATSQSTASSSSSQTVVRQPVETQSSTMPAPAETAPAPVEQTAPAAPQAPASVPGLW